MPRPLVAISTCRRMIGGYDKDCTGSQYSRVVVEQAGGMAVLVPNVAADLPAREFLGQVDGLLLTGSAWQIHHDEFIALPGLHGCRSPLQLPALLASLPSP